MNDVQQELLRTLRVIALRKAVGEQDAALAALRCSSEFLQAVLVRTAQSFSAFGGVYNRCVWRSLRFPQGIGCTKGVQGDQRASAGGSGFAE